MKFRSFQAINVCRNCGRPVPSNYNYCTAARCQEAKRATVDAAVRQHLVCCGKIKQTKVS